MPIFEYVCDNNHYQEEICRVSDMTPTVQCRVCGGIAKRTFTPSGHYTGNQDGEWVRNCLGIFNRKDSDPDVKKAFDTPTRSNVMAALRKKGYNLNEKGSKPEHRQTSDEYINESHPRFMRRWMEKNRIEVRSR